MGRSMTAIIETTMEFDLFMLAILWSLIVAFVNDNDYGIDDR